MAFDSATIVRELRHLLIGQYEREGQRRATRTAAELTTAVACSKTNQEFVALSGVGAEWTAEATWAEVKRILATQLSNSPKVNAARYLLYLQNMSATSGLVDEREWRQQRAAEVLGLDWNTNKFRFREDRTVKFASDIVDGALSALQHALLTATKSAAARASASSATMHAEHLAVESGWTDSVEGEMVRRLERLPLHYPAGLTTSILAPMLNPHIRVPADDPTPGAIPSLPPLWRDESEDVSELLRAAGARAYVIGEPGTGKSTMLRSVVLTQMKELPGAVGVFVPLIDLAEELPERTLSLTEVLDVIIDVNSRLYTPVDAEARERVSARLGTDDATVICLDGLDEVPEGRLTDRARRAVETLTGIPGALVVSSRPGPRVNVPSGWDTVAMHSVRSESAKELLELWFGDSNDFRKSRALAVLESKAASDISGSPLLLGFVAYAASFDREFDSLSDLYEQYIALTLERSWKTAGLQEPSDVVIENLMHLARLLAWRMAYGNEQQKVSRWRESETLSQMLRTVERPDREDIARIVQAEGLFTMAVAAASRLHTSYRWVHRTVQEHLVAMYMQEREGSHSSEMVDRLLGLLSSGDDWRVVATHLFTRMSSEAQLALIRRLIEVRNDPRYITGEPDKLLEGLVEVFEDEAALAVLAEDASQRGVWPGWFYVDPQGARTALLAAADTAEPIDILGAHAPELGQHFDADFLRDLISRLVKRPKLHYGVLLEACVALESREPLAGVFAFFDVIAAGPPGLPRFAWPTDLLEALDLAAVAQRISECPDRAVRWRLLHFFMVCLRGEVSLFLAPEGPLDTVDFDLVQIAENKIIGSAYSLGNTMRGAIAGDHGDVIAYVAAKGLSPEAVREIVEYPWGVVGAWEHVLINGGEAGGTALIRDEPCSAAEAIAAYRPEWRSDPEKMRQLYRAIADSMIRPDTVDTPTFIELYRQLLVDPDRSEYDYVNARVAVRAVEKTLDAVVHIRGYVDIAEEILRQDPQAWAGSDGRIPALAAYLSGRYGQKEDNWGDAEYEQHWHEVSQMFYDVTNWGARADMPLMPLFVSYFMEAPTTRELVLGALNREVLSVPGNLAWLDHTMMLFYPHFWRENRSKYLAPLLTAEISRSIQHTP